MRLKGVACTVLAVLLCVASAASARPAARPYASGERYFIEFRARSAEPIGHTFIVYGRLDAAGRVVEVRHAGLIPKENVWRTLVLSGPGAVRAEPDDRARPTIAIYRRWLTADEYRGLLARLQRLQAKRHRWHVIFSNCNDFAIEIADTLRLRRLPSLLPPQVWVESLRTLNGG